MAKMELLGAMVSAEARASIRTLAKYEKVTDSELIRNLIVYAMEQKMLGAFEAMERAGTTWGIVEGALKDNLVEKFIAQCPDMNVPRDNLGWAKWREDLRNETNKYKFEFEAYFKELHNFSSENIVALEEKKTAMAKLAALIKK